MKIFLTLFIIPFMGFMGAQVIYDVDVALIETYSGRYNYSVTGGSLRTEMNTVDPCSVTNIDSAPLQDVPLGADKEIVKAYLYWAGNGPDDEDVTFEANGISINPTPIRSYNAQRYRDSSLAQGYQDFFSRTADITDFVKSLPDPNTTYTFSDLTVSLTDLYCLPQNVLASWHMVVVYKDESQVFQKKVNIYEGLDMNRANLKSFTIGGINVPPNAEGKVTGVFLEGDENLANAWDGYTEILRFKGTALTDADNPDDNAYNSTRNYPDASSSEWGVDIDTYDVSDLLDAGDRSVAMTVGAGQDFIMTNTIILAVDTYIPEITIVKTSDKEEAGERVRPGDTINYTISVSNAATAKEIANNVNIIDQLPNGVTYLGPTLRDYYINAPLETANIDDSPFRASDDTFDPSSSWYFDDGYYNTQDLTISIDETHEKPQIKTLTLDITGSSLACEDLFLTLYGPSGAIKSYEYGDITCSGGDFSISDTFTPTSNDAVDGSPIGSYYLVWYDAYEDNADYWDNYSIYSKLSIEYEYIPANSRVAYNDQNTASENLVTTDEEIDIYPGETIVITMPVTVDEDGPFEMLNTASITADNIYEPISDTALDKTITCAVPAPDGNPRKTFVGISSLDRNVEDWLNDDTQNELGAYLYLESTKKGLAITRNADPEQNIINPVEGMLVWDTTLQCLRLYGDVGEGILGWKCLMQGCNK